MIRQPRFTVPVVVLLALAATLLFASSAFALAGATPALVSGSSELGAAEGTRTVVLTLTPRDGAGLQALADDPARARLAPNQFEQSFAPTPQTVGAVESWAAANGLQVDAVSTDRLLVTLSASTSALGKALGVSFERFRAPDGTSYVSSTATAALPSSIAADVSAISGLSSLERAQVQAPHATPGEVTSVSYPSSYGPQELWSLYHAPAAATGAGEQVSIISAGDLSQPKADLATFEQKFGLPTVTWNQINVGASSSETEGDDEWDLDTQYSTGFAPGVGQVNVYVGSSLEDASILATVDRWVTDDATSQASFSAGECELLADVAGFTEGLDTVLTEAAAQGQTLFTSSGDTGSQCPVLVGENGVPLGAPGVNYPASSAHAIGVGGTSVLGAGNEIGWYSGGGGQSLIESTPAWQKNAGGSFIGATRGVPDVAMDADPESGFKVVVNGAEEIVGGTSAGAPSWQGIWARAEAAHEGKLGFAGPVIYEREPESAFTDIILGDNGLYPCTPGWDYVTGRGTPDIEAFVAGA